MARGATICPVTAVSVLARTKAKFCESPSRRVQKYAGSPADPETIKTGRCGARK